jgi:hypothetical protein
MLINNNNSKTGTMLGSSDLTTKYRQLKPYKTGEIRILLLENINSLAKKIFEDAGFQV